MIRSSDLLAPARALLVSRLTPSSFAHCERVAAAARALAERVGVDPDGAELAGLVHDYARDEPREGLVAMAEELGMTVLPVEREDQYLLHARLGATMLHSDLPGVGEAVLSAVAVHTVGGVPMADLDKVVYLADMIEPERDYPGVEDVRASCATDTLDECFRVGYGRTVRHLREQGRVVHPVSGAVSAAIEQATGRALFDPREVRS